MHKRVMAAAGLTLALAACAPATPDPYAAWSTCVRTVEPTDQGLYECDRAYYGAGGTGTPTTEGILP